MYDNELYHHGVKGMKWGVRKSRSSKKKTRGWSKEAKEADRIKKKSVHQMTNKELQTLNKRMELESKYHQLNPNKVKQGLKFVGAVAGGMGTVMALYNNSNNLINIGKKFAKNFK